MSKWAVSIMAGFVSGVACLSGEATARELTFNGGPFDALTAVLPDDGKPTSEGFFLPGVAREKLPSAEGIEIIHSSVLPTYRDWYDGEDNLLADGQDISEYCGMEGGAEIGCVLAHCVTEAPFVLQDRQVRLNVLCGGQLTHFLFFDVTDDGVGLHFSEAHVPDLPQQPLAGDRT